MHVYVFSLVSKCVIYCVCIGFVVEGKYILDWMYVNFVTVHVSVYVFVSV